MGVDKEQKPLWKGPAGHPWVELQALLDGIYKPFEDLLAGAASAASATSVLDVGCGTGSTTLATARSLGAKGRCTGVDISRPVIAAARARAERESTRTSFVCADAQTHPFEPAGFDMIISRFGVMFFEDPIKAFANLRQAASDGAELRFIAWRSAGENPFMTTAERAAAPLLPDLPGYRPGTPGQFALADRRRLVAILGESGWTDIDIRPIDVVCTLPADQLVPYLSRLGPVGQALRETDERTRARVIERVRAAFNPYVYGAEVRFTAACWMASARAPAASGEGTDA